MSTIIEKLGTLSRDSRTGARETRQGSHYKNEDSHERGEPGLRTPLKGPLLESCLGKCFLRFSFLTEPRLHYKLGAEHHNGIHLMPRSWKLAPRFQKKITEAS